MNPFNGTPYIHVLVHCMYIHVHWIHILHVLVTCLHVNGRQNPGCKIYERFFVKLATTTAVGLLLVYLYMYNEMGDLIKNCPKEFMHVQVHARVQTSLFDCQKYIHKIKLCSVTEIEAEIIAG